MRSGPGTEPLRPGDPTQLGPYRMLGRLGRGGMGTVYLAETGGGEAVAVKVINTELADDPSFRDRFRREVQSARRVRRFCTAPVIDASLDDDPLYVVTEYVEGPSVQEWIRTGGPMHGASLEQLAVGIATALTAIHSAQIVHRDLKPANVLLSPIGPRVIDFGIARALDSVTQATRTGHFVGTPAYMAPEVIAGQTASPAADVFAWGAVVAYAGTARAPFEAATIPAILYRVTQGEPVLDGLDPAVRAMVERALAKDPRQRPTAQQLLDGLVGHDQADTAKLTAAIRHDWPILTIPDNPPSPLLMPPPPPVPNAFTQPPPPLPSGSPKRRGLLIGAAAVAGAAMAGALVFLALGGDEGPPTDTAVVFSDDFAGKGAGWAGGDFGHYSFTTSGYADGQYAIQVMGSDTAKSAVAPYKPTMPGRALISTDVRVQQGPDYGNVGLFCRDPSTITKWYGYQFSVRVDGKGASLRKVNGDTISQQLAVTSESTGFERATTNRIQIACEQQGRKVRLRLWINHDLAVDHTDASGALADGGRSGLFVAQEGSSGNGVVARFDNFEIAEIKG